mmetsp:Transcript_12983/g.41496  ORF Transcript_12983/g.41496 Transcript_12983/m.41496 type:complete len:225 (-) Transcript_12983:723-1397(-)
MDRHVNVQERLADLGDPQVDTQLHIHTQGGIQFQLAVQSRATSMLDCPPEVTKGDESPPVDVRHSHAALEGELRVPRDVHNDERHRGTALEEHAALQWIVRRAVVVRVWNGQILKEVGKRALVQDILHVRHSERDLANRQRDGAAKGEAEADHVERDRPVHGCSQRHVRHPNADDGHGTAKEEIDNVLRDVVQDVDTEAPAARHFDTSMRGGFGGRSKRHTVGR